MPLQVKLTKYVVKSNNMKYTELVGSLRRKNNDGY